MKIAKENNPSNLDAMFSTGVEEVEKKNFRIHSVVADNYDFDTNDATDVTTIETLSKYGHKGDIADALLVKDSIYALFLAKTGADEAARWANCNSEEKDILAKLWLVSPNLVAEIIPDVDTRKYFYGMLVKDIVAARQSRINTITIVFGEKLSVKADRVDMYNTVMARANSYVASGDTDIIDYINSTGSYDNTTGFESKSYYTESLKESFNSIVTNGLLNL